MRHSILTLLIATISALGLFAQDTEGSKILVFRNTGEINIFNSDSISKVELSVFDTDSIQHDDFVTQVFHQKNQSFMAIPLAEIDSVAFGYRNIIEPKKGVRRLTDEETDAISSFDGETLLYDSRLILHEGETVYYDRITNTLPIGLCVKIKNIFDGGNTHKANVTWLNASEVFERYLLTGDAKTNINTPVKKAADLGYELFKLDLPEYDQNGIKVNGSVELSLNLSISDFVKDAIKDYQHAEIKVSASPKIEFSASSDDSDTVELETPEDKRLHKRLPFLNGALLLDITLDAFLDIMAELGVQYELEQDHSIVIEWTKHKGKSSFSKPVIESQQLNEATQKIEVHLNGEIFFGPKLDISIGTVLDLIGAGIKLKAGPKLEGEFSLGVIQQLSKQFDSEIYGKANLFLKGGLKLETYEFHRNWKNLFEIEENKLPFTAEAFADFYTIPIFPEFNSKAVMTKDSTPFVRTGKEPEAVSISSFVEEELPYPLDISFEIADKDTDETLAETEVIDTLEKEMADYQTIYSEIIIPSNLGKIDKDAIVARPVINYKGYKVKAKPAGVAGDMLMTPNICSMAGGSSYFVSGMTPVSQHTFGETTYIEGNLVGYGVKSDPRFRKRNFSTVDFVNMSDLDDAAGQPSYSHPLFGSWTGTIAKENVKFTFIDNKTGKYNDSQFTYKYNSPYNGGIAIKLDDGGSISFSIIAITEETLTIVMKGAEDETVLQRQK